MNDPIYNDQALLVDKTIIFMINEEFMRGGV